MNTLAVTIKSPTKRNKKVLVEFDASKFEGIAANFGLFNSNFLKSISKSEKDYKTGKSREIKSLKDLK